MRAAAEAAGQLFDKEIDGFSVDSRACGRGELFFALSPQDYARHYFTSPPDTDSHRFVPEALERGALAAVVRRGNVEAYAELAPYADRLLVVGDVIEALQLLARGTIEEWGRPVVGITGSAGKTTTKDLTAHVLGVAGRRVLRSRKNFNNELGVALSVLQMETGGARPEDFDVVVLEMGMSLPGEIARHCEVAPPDIGVVLLVAPAHLEFMGSLDAIEAGKAQMVEGIKPGGIAVLNGDDERVARMARKHSGRVVTYGVEHAADVKASEVESAGVGLSSFLLRTPYGETMVRLPMPGRHNVLNALAAAAVATCFEVDAETIADALSTAAPSEMRGEVHRFDAGVIVIDDSYNSNPRSLVSMAEAAAQGGESVSRRIVVAGEMLELGPEAAAIHREAGREIGSLGVDVLWGVRGHARELIEGAREAGMGESATRYFESADEAAAEMAEFVRPGDLVLVKGSRGVHVEKVVERLKEQYGGSDE